MKSKCLDKTAQIYYNIYIKCIKISEGEFMHSLKYHLYVFSMEREHTGRIVANKSRTGSWLCGKNFFRALKISRSDELFFKNTVNRDKMSAVVLLSGGKAPHAVVIYSFLSFELSLFVAIEYVVPPALSSEILFSVCSQYVEFSPDVLKVLQGSEGKSFNERLHEGTYLDILYLSGRLMSVHNFGTTRKYTDTPELQDIFETIAKLVGIELEVYTENHVPHNLYLPVLVFSGATAVATMLVMAMITRVFSSDNILHAHIDAPNLSFIIECTSGEKCEDTLKYLRRYIESNHSMPFDFDLSDGRVRVAAIPAYEDEGASSEVKNDDVVLLFRKND